MKRLLRDKANFAVIEGLLTTLLGRKTKINRLLESEGNQLNEADKFNRIDILAENDLGELIFVYCSKYHYFCTKLLEKVYRLYIFSNSLV